MAHSEQFLSPETNRPGTPSPSQPSSPVTLDHPLLQDDTRSVHSNRPNTRPPSLQYLSPPSPNAIGTQTLPLPSPSSPSFYRPHSIHSNHSSPSIARSSASTRPPSLRSMDSRISEYRKHTGSGSSVRVERYFPAVSPLNDTSSRGTASQQFQPHPSHGQPLLADGERIVALPLDGQRNSIMTGTTNVAGLSNAVAGEEAYTLNIDPMLPTGLKRYDLRRPDEEEPDDSVPRLTAYYPDHESDYPHRQWNPIPEGWQICTHPEGAVFYYHEGLRTFTDVNVCKEDIHVDIMFYAGHFWDKLMMLLGENSCNIKDHQKQILKSQSMLVVEPQLNEAGDEVIIRYYFVNPDGQSVFWLHDMNHDFFVSTELAITALYWKHWDMYPVQCDVNETLVHKIKNIILHAKCDHTTSRFAAGLTPTEINDCLSILSNIKADCAETGMHVACTIGRIMFTITYYQYINFHGQPCARLNSNDSVYGWKYQRSLWMKVCSWLLFRAPDSYITMLHDIYVDSIANKYTWRNFITELITQLQDFNLLATVLLNANVGFLAIQSVDGSSGEPRSWTQIASYWSLTSSIGSIVLGAFLVRFHQGSVHKDAEAVAKFLNKMHSQRNGLERLAIVYSIPIVAFFSAFVIESCQKGQRRDLVCVSTVFGITLTLIVYGISTILHGSCNRGILERLSSVTFKFPRRQNVAVASSSDDPSISSHSRALADHVKTQWHGAFGDESSVARSHREEASAETAQDFAMTPVHVPRFTLTSPEEQHQSHELPLHRSRSSPT
ncbi:hypothetical protein CONPUDRAFT_156504 [Coniophora puteana RWD-64-598 SS2]|uniref:WW domain-containing protein n=1 Tax=Coniophora puteana (strain RWD-64-598) TaxID=741705 RepID=A0A5M3MH25_CONPW|nr:uncharacterized protein CONPUDRAFT_156504 [Coniophora puteana RWD-64-598 SS2]EIW78522.1 hypothetical protein CONPUDRAFT_156504 [Coniophora puteana RWD-64-598 SS2]